MSTVSINGIFFNNFLHGVLWHRRDFIREVSLVLISISSDSSELESTFKVICHKNHLDIGKRRLKLRNIIKVRDLFSGTVL